jgi:hypothetical protein
MAKQGFEKVVSSLAISPAQPLPRKAQDAYSQSVAAVVAING